MRSTPDEMAETEVGGPDGPACVALVPLAPAARRARITRDLTRRSSRI